MEKMLDRTPYTIAICEGPDCIKNDSRKLRERVVEEIRSRGLENQVTVLISGCLGMCHQGPMMIVNPGFTLYCGVQESDIAEIISEHILKGRPIARLITNEDHLFNRFYRIFGDVNFFGRQMRIALRNCGIIDPESIDDYLAVRGYEALAKALTSMTPQQVIAEMKNSGLRGRGGAGFSTGLKWELTAQTPGDIKYVICNADEGDPGAFMDRSAIEGDPHTVLEGMAIAGYAIGAQKGFIYIRAEYPLAIERLKIAIDQARKEGFLGKNILGSAFSFDIEIRLGAGAFVCGEETALIHSIEGMRGMPTMKPPYPSVSGLFGKPTVINNVETWASVPVVIVEGAAWFSSIGTASSKGTKVFALAGNVRNTGLIEVPMGTTLRQIIYEVGGGIAGGKKFKAAQTGGPSGGCIPAQFLDTPIDYESLAKIGSIMGSGGMIVVDENSCMVNMARFFLEFTQDESCGKCTPCREGTRRMLEILTRIVKGDGLLEDIDLLEKLATTIKASSLCGLGQSAPNPVLSTLKYFKEEYIEHIVHKKCRAGVCTELTGAPCQSACPLGTEAWRYIAHIERGETLEAYQAIRGPNPMPSVCARVCNHPCERSCRAGRVGGEAISIRALKRHITDTVDPSVFQPQYVQANEFAGRVAVVGGGPAGISAAHYLALSGHSVTIFEAESRLGGILVSGIPAYRLPREMMNKEFGSLLSRNVTVEYNKRLGKDFTIDSLMAQGFNAVFLAVGSHKSLRMGIEGEDCAGVYSSMEFLKAYNLHGKKLARGRVGVIGGGNSSPDGARIALRQEGVENVTIYYRRSREEMPVFEEEIEAALEEGVRLETLVAPARIVVENGQLKGVEFVKNALGPADESGRRRPVTVKGSEKFIPLDTLIVAISEKPEKECIPGDIEMTSWGTVAVNPHTLATSRRGVFAGGDVVTGPNTVVDALAAGRTAARSIDLMLRKIDPFVPPSPSMPAVYIEASKNGSLEKSSRAKISHLPLEKRRGNTDEIELALDTLEARREAGRCMRCDLEFTMAPAGAKKRKPKQKILVED